jgi:uncharacterized membrane protein
MSLLPASVDLPWAALGWLLLAPPAWRSWRALRARAMLQGAQQHLWLAAIVLVAWLWTLQQRAAPAAGFGWLGVAVFALVFGRDWARLGLIAAVALHTLLAGGHWMNLGLDGVLLAALPTAMAEALRRQVERRLPPNLFVFIIGNGLFVMLAVTAATSVARLAVAGIVTAAFPAAEQFAYALLLAWGEALASGMLFAALVIFGPNLVPTYSQDRYLPRRRR